MNRPGTPNNNTSGRHISNSSPARPDDATYRAALTGASLAFQRTAAAAPSRSSPAVGTSTSNRGRDNGALIAATSASRDHSLSRSASRASNVRISRQTTGNSVVSTQNGGGGNGNNHGEVLEHAAVSQRLAQLQQQSTQQQLHGQNATFLRRPAPGGRPAIDPRSPSLIAATLAASRSASVSPHHTGQQQQQQPAQTHQHHPYAQQAATRVKRKGSVGTPSAASSVTSLDLVTDTTSIPPTNALIFIFENKDGNTDPVKKGPDSTPTSKKARPDNVKPRLRPMTPPRTLSPVVKRVDVSPSRVASNLAWERATSPTLSVSSEVRHGVLEPLVDSKKRPPTPPPTRWTMDAAEGSGHAAPKRKPPVITPPPKSAGNDKILIHSPQPRRRTASKKILSAEGLDAPVVQKKAPVVKPKPWPPSISTLPNRAITSGGAPASPETALRRPLSTSSQDTFVSASSAPSPDPALPPRGRPRPAPALSSNTQARPSQSAPNSPNRSPRRQPVPPPPRRSQAPSNLALNLNSLTSATMAGILASSRAPPTTAATLLAAPPSRTLTPQMRQTLRQPRAMSDDEGAKGNKKHLRKKHLMSNNKKHSHHEGARGRWREEITARERKRYEGVWASNRGLLMLTQTDLQSNHQSSNYSSSNGNGSENNGEQLVVNVVVRDIWARSRLPFDELAEVWDLVDKKGRGVLDKTEFVVGMWLIDQRLRGMKIPQKVHESVWFSAKGVRVLGPKRKH